MPSKLTLYDKSGRRLDEINASCKVEYKINEWGKLTFTISTSDPKCTEKNLRFGNYVIFEHDKLPTWGGMFDPPYQWGHGTITIMAYSGEYILSMRHTAKQLDAEGTPGGVFQTLVENINTNDGYKIIQIGSIYGGGASIKRTYNYANIYDEVKKLSKDTANDYEIIPIIDANGRLYFQANWYEKKGRQTAMTFYEDKNVKLSSGLLREQGRISNQLTLYGDGSSFKSRPTAYRENIDSIGLYGIRQTASQSQGDDIETNADNLIKTSAYPRKTFDITAMDVGNTFQECRIGNTYPVNFYSVGFSGSGFGVSANIRILQMTYSDDANTLKLVADEEVADGD